MFKTYLPWRTSVRLSGAEGGGRPGGDSPMAKRSFYEVATALSFAGDVHLEDMEEMIV